MEKFVMNFLIKVPEEDVFGILKQKINNKKIKNFIFTKGINESIKEEVFILCDEYLISLYEINDPKKNEILKFFVEKGKINSGVKGILFFLLQNDFVLHDNEVLLGTTRDKIISVIYKEGKYIFNLFDNINKKEKLKQYYLIALDNIVD